MPTLNAAKKIHLPHFGVCALCAGVCRARSLLSFANGCESNRRLDLNKNVKFIIIWNGNDDHDDSDTAKATESMSMQVWSNRKQLCTLETGRDSEDHISGIRLVYL